ncbi:MAG: hypothetical protein LBP80_12035 [Treponema sp.]|jgi:hypothetical protein|nr:hypothetical protein [Treponema sp.]
MSGSARGGNNRRKPFRRRDRTGDETAAPGRNSWQDNSFRKGRRQETEFSGFRSAGGPHFERPRWTPVKLPPVSFVLPDCPICGKPIKDVSSALTDKASGNPAHFDCVLAKIADNEIREKGDAISYLGGGRFGIVHYANPHNIKRFKIKKIIEWEDRENRADWRKAIADHFSVT